MYDFFAVASFTKQSWNIPQTELNKEDVDKEGERDI